MIRHLSVTLLVAAACLLAAAASGEDRAPARGIPGLGETLTFGGSLRGAYWSSSRTLDGREDFPVAALWLGGRWEPDPTVALVGDGWVMNDDLFHAGATHGELREAYLDVRLGSFDARLGKQIIAWGRADRINPTDTLTPRDFTLLVPEAADQRTGTTGALLTYRFGGTALTGIALPTFEPHVVPLERPPPGSTLRERVPDDPVLQGAIKLERTGGRVDWSVSYFDGYDLFPDLVIDRVRLDGVDLLTTHHRIRVVGADAAAALGPYTVRGEAAYTFTEHERRGDEIKSPFFFMVLGVDRTLTGAVYVNLQYIVRVVSDWQRPSDEPDPVRRRVAIEQALINDQLDRVRHAVALRVSRSWLHDTLVTELSAIVSPTRWDYAIRPQVKYAVTDRLKLTAGADVFGGPTPSFFGRLRDNTTAYVEVRWDF